ncbi:hypothetical protein [Microcoleus sp. herbarium14]
MLEKTFLSVIVQKAVERLGVLPIAIHPQTSSSVRLLNRRAIAN